MPQSKPRLFVLPPSHYCERARWALDHMGIDYAEEAWAVGLHIPLARRIAPRTTLPILHTGTEVIQGSGNVLSWTGMSGADEEVESRFETRIGVLVRQYIYAGTLGDHGAAVSNLLFSGLSPKQAFTGRLAWPVTRRMMIAGMNARPELVPELERKLAAELDWFEGVIAGKRHISGAGLGRADITAASLLAPLARPAACPLYRQAALPPRLDETLERWSVRPSLRWVESLYAEHR